MYSGVTSLTAANGYTIRNGDVLAWRQYQDGSTTGGLFLYFTDHTDGLAAQDTDGQLIDQDTTMNSWHMRTVDLSQFAGKTIQLVDPFQWTNAPAGNWDIYYGDIVLVSTDGTSIPIYNRTMTSLSVATNAAVNNFSAITEKVIAYSPIDTTYYHGDQISSTHLQTSYAGWPISSDTYSPFGAEATPSADGNHYKFTGLERDQESGFDHAMFRQYSSTMGRWLSPDPYMGSYDLSNPQSFNRYTYVLNNPLSMSDPSGTDPNCTSEDDGGMSDGCYSMGGDPGIAGGGNSIPATVVLQSVTVTAAPDPPMDLDAITNWMTSELTNWSTPSNGVALFANAGGSAPSNTACNIQRATSGVMGAANLGLAVGKGFALGGAVAGLGATGVGAPAAAVLAVYGTVSIFGQGLTGAAQLYSAATGNYGTAGRVAQIGNILSGPVSGLGTLLSGGSLAAAERNAGYESAFTAGAGLIDAIRAGGAGLPLAMADHNTAQMSLFGAGGGNACGAGH